MVNSIESTMYEVHFRIFHENLLKSGFIIKTSPNAFRCNGKFAWPVLSSWVFGRIKNNINTWRSTVNLKMFSIKVWEGQYMQLHELNKIIQSFHAEVEISFLWLMSCLYRYQKCCVPLCIKTKLQTDVFEHIWIQSYVSWCI